MTLPRSVADVLASHVTLELECIDRMYLNVYQPKLMYMAVQMGELTGYAAAEHSKLLRQCTLYSRSYSHSGDNTWYRLYAPDEIFICVCRSCYAFPFIAG